MSYEIYVLDWNVTTNGTTEERHSYHKSSEDVGGFIRQIQEQAKKGNIIYRSVGHGRPMKHAVNGNAIGKVLGSNKLGFWDNELGLKS
ncbi:MAG TPA: hypothetical protein VHQ41_00865 [Patescibacteria group bacterium]|jgi:hypothetical protein|nr:hypothetical protein [Patescibacteria group bacterium]